MSRVSKYDKSKIETNEVIWKAGLYLRLSKEDDVSKDESDSISSQRELLLSFIKKDPKIDIYNIYVDDGYSGTTFDRPNFQRMWEDIKNGRINCVVVKDLSRFGRNTIETSNYIEVIFPMLKVRFISLTDQIDSYLNPQSINGLLVPFKNIMNDEYARDISVKVKSAQNTYRNKGLFIGSFPSYGYIKDPNDKHKLIIRLFIELYYFTRTGRTCIR